MPQINTITGPHGLYYVQDTRTILGNDLMWWAIDGKGYTSDLSRAEIWKREDAFRQCEMTTHFRPWPKQYIDKRTRPAVDCQYVQLKDTGVTIPKSLMKSEARFRRKPENCDGCGRFLNDVQVVVGCLHCGAGRSF